MLKLQGALGFRTVGAGFGLIALVALGMGGASCGSSSSGGGDTTDGGTDTNQGGDSPNDTKVTDSKPGDTHTSDTPVDTGPPDITSNLLAEGNYYVLDDVSGAGTGTITSDGYVAVLDASKTPNKLVAIPVAGGAPIDIVDKGDYAYPAGAFLVVYSNVNTTTFIGTMGVWSKAGGYHQLSTASRAGNFAISLDGKLISYSDKESTKTADVIISDMTGTTKNTLATASKNDTTCNPNWVATATKIAVELCDVPSTGVDAGVEVGVDAGPVVQTSTLSLYDNTGTTGTLIATNLIAQISGSKAGDKIFTLTTTGDAVVYAADGSGSTPIDTGVLFGRILDDGSKALYSKPSASGATSGPLYTATVGATPSPVKITDDVVAVFFNPPAGSTYAEYGKNYDPTTQQSDLFLAALAGGGTPITVSADTATSIFGDPFTNDNKFAIFYTNVSAGAGDLDVIDITTAGAKQLTLANNTWVSYSPKGQTVIYNDNWTSGGFGSEGVADIRLTGSDGSGRHYIAAQAENNFYITPDRTKVIYATGDPSAGKNGLYSATLP